MVVVVGSSCGTPSVGRRSQRLPRGRRPLAHRRWSRRGRRGARAATRRTGGAHGRPVVEVRLRFGGQVAGGPAACVVAGAVRRRGELAARRAVRVALDRDGARDAGSHQRGGGAHERPLGPAGNRTAARQHEAQRTGARGRRVARQRASAWANSSRGSGSTGWSWRSRWSGATGAASVRPRRASRWSRVHRSRRPAWARSAGPPPPPGGCRGRGRRRACRGPRPRAARGSCATARAAWRRRPSPRRHAGCADGAGPRRRRARAPGARRRPGVGPSRAAWRVAVSSWSRNGAGGLGAPARSGARVRRKPSATASAARLASAVRARARRQAGGASWR